MGQVSIAVKPIEIVTRSAAETATLGERLAKLLRAGDVILLQGDLGAGKTTLTQGIGRGLCLTEHVQSPSFILVAEYDGQTADGEPLRLYHLDLYRLGGEADLESIGFADYLEPIDGVSVIEWPERAEGELPERYLLIRIAPADDDARRITISPMPPDSAEHAQRFAGLVTVDETTPR